MSTRRAWAIATGGDHNTLIGVGRFSMSALPPWQNGFRTAVFDSRKKAREHLAKVKGPSIMGLYPYAHVVRVAIELKVAA